MEKCEDVGHVAQLPVWPLFHLRDGCWFMGTPEEGNRMIISDTSHVKIKEYFCLCYVQSCGEGFFVCFCFLFLFFW